MERSSEGESDGIDDSPEAPRPPLSTAEAIQEIVRFNARASLASEHHLLLFLQAWWSKLYNRPLKDPLLLSYTIEELLYEYYDKQERELAEMEAHEEGADRMEERKVQSNLDWAAEEEKKELEALKAKELTEANAPDDEEWMEEQIQKELEQGRKLYGKDFGEDIEG